MRLSKTNEQLLAEHTNNLMINKQSSSNSRKHRALVQKNQHKQIK